MNHFEILKQVLSDKNIVGVISSSIFIMMLGLFLGKRQTLKSNLSAPLGELILVLAIPALSFNAFMKDFNIDIFVTGVNIFIWSFLLHIILILTSKYFYKNSTEKKQLPLEMMTIFSGVTVFGIPIVQAIYGDLGVIYASVFSIPYRILLYSYGFFRMSGIPLDKKNIKSMIFNPVIVATFLGLFIWVFQEFLPHIEINNNRVSIFRIDKTAIWLYKPLSFLASLCSPLAWLAAGLKLSEVSIKSSLQDFTSWYFSIIKTCFVPILSLALILLGNYSNLISVSDIGIGVIVIMMGTPTASVVIAYSLKYDKDPLTASSCSLLSTLFSIITIPLMIIILQIISL